MVSSGVRRLYRQHGSRKSTWMPATNVDVLDLASSPEEAKSWLATQEARESWDASQAQLEDLGLDPEACNKLLAKGFAWTSRAYWGQEKARRGHRTA